MAKKVLAAKLIYFQMKIFYFKTSSSARNNEIYTKQNLTNIHLSLLDRLSKQIIIVHKVHIYLLKNYYDKAMLRQFEALLWYYQMNWRHYLLLLMLWQQMELTRWQRFGLSQTNSEIGEFQLQVEQILQLEEEIQIYVLFSLFLQPTYTISKEISFS